MPLHISPSLTEVLRSTLAQLESSLHLNPNDTALQGLKRSVLRTIAELEIIKMKRPDW